jgi:hypothetical protein
MKEYKGMSPRPPFRRKFVVLFHELESDPLSHQVDRSFEGKSTFMKSNHWDFMLEYEDQLFTWALGKEPFVHQTLPAKQLSPHRLHYLSYEGPLSENRGNVRRTHAGHYQVVSCPTAENRTLMQEVDSGLFSVELKFDQAQAYLLELRKIIRFQRLHDQDWTLHFAVK